MTRQADHGGIDVQPDAKIQPDLEDDTGAEAQDGAGDGGATAQSDAVTAASMGDMEGEPAVHGSQQRPQRTLAVILLDPILDVLAAIGTVARRVGLGRSGGDRRMVRGIIIASVAILGGTAALVAVLIRAPDQLAPLGVAPGPGSAVDATSGTGTPGLGFGPAASLPPTPRAPAAGPAATPPAASTRPPTAAPSPLAGKFTIEDAGLVSYRASVAIGNPGPAAVTGWTLVITLPRQTLSISDVVGAVAQRDGATWTLVPDQSTRQVSGNGAVQVRFRVDGASLGAAPTTCTVDGRPCEGVPH
jgi:hypothetical protein